MKPTLLLSLLASLLVSAAGVRAATPEVVLNNIYGRSAVSLNGKWNYIIDPYDNGYLNYRREPFDLAEHPTGGYFLDRQAKDGTELLEYNFDRSPTLTVPGDWNSQEDKLLYYEGTVWYRRHFDCAKAAPTDRIFVHFGAVNYEADVYVNGTKLGKHIGGFTPFAYEITALVKPRDNSIVLRVNNQRHLEGVPTTNTDWWNYGGITRDVQLVETPATFISVCSLQLSKGDEAKLAGHLQLDGAQAQQKVSVAIAGTDLKADVTTDASGAASWEMPASALARWSPADPKLYAVSFNAETDHLAEKIGFRTIAVRGSDILLNGKPIFLRGVCIHEENPQRGGRAYSPEDARLLLGWAKELNCNFVRLAHYPHNEHMARTADELGIMVWEEVPVYWTIQWENPATLANAQHQLRDVITRDHNRASVIVWSVANETPRSPARTQFLKALVDTARAADGTRLISAAMEVRPDPADPDHKIVDDEFGEFTDLQSFNEYVGWYDGLPDKLARVRWTIKSDKPVVISEFGGDALQGWHADTLTRFCEEYQEDLYRKTIAMLQKIPQWRGSTPWILCDFRSPRRTLPNVQDGWNRKGLIGENGTKKKAFYVLRNFYNEVAVRGTGAP